MMFEKVSLFLGHNSFTNDMRTAKKETRISGSFDDEKKQGRFYSRHSPVTSLQVFTLNIKTTWS